MRGSLLQCSYVSIGQKTSQTASGAGRQEYDRAYAQDVPSLEYRGPRGRRSLTFVKGAGFATKV
jgi:hypothetical protein